MSFQAASSGPEGLPDGLSGCPGTGMSPEDAGPARDPWADDLWEPGLSEEDYWSSLSPLDDEPLPEWDADGEIVGLASVADQFADALAQLDPAADTLIRLGADPGLVLADRDRLIDCSRRLERVRNKLACPDQCLINLMEATGCRIDGPMGLYPSPQAYLNALHGIRWGDARSRVRAAGFLAPKVEMNGHRIEPRYPVLAEAQAAGEIAPDRMDLVTKALTEWEKLLDIEDSNLTVEALEVAEEVLARQARVFGGRELERIIGRLSDYLNPDGMVDDRPAQDAVRSFEVRPVGRGLHKGMYRAEGWLTAEAGAKMTAVLDPLAKPQPVTDQTGRVVEPDRRDRGMRMHDAVEEVLDRSLRAGDLPAHGGTPTTLIITAQAGDVFAGTGTGATETGDELPMETVTALADEAEIVRTVFHKETREVLFLGRTRRLASYAQTLALAARDGGCTFPGCSKSAKWCQRHHILDWVKGGKTDLPNLTLLCSFHHYRFAKHGWTAEYRDGRVWWRPPKIIDPYQEPLLNTRHRGTPLITWAEHDVAGFPNPILDNNRFERHSSKYAFRRTGGHRPDVDARHGPSSALADPRRAACE